MHIVIATGAMSFGPHTLMFKSLGGSETAALMLGKALAARGHEVFHFCNLPAQGEPDHFPGGYCTEDKVTYIPAQMFAQYVALNAADLQIVTRDPNFAALPSLARKKVLWMHDIAVKRGMKRAFEQMEWTIDEVWTVSEWHRQQVHTATGYPLKNIKALRNGIVPVEDLLPPFKQDKVLVYAARPERGLENLIKPGGIMENLPEYTLKVAMYNHFPEDMRNYYEAIFARMKEMPNVEFVGSLKQKELRAMIRDAAAYIYPTQFEETSCILARECIEQRTPFLTTREGALPETLGDCGTFFEDWFAEGYDLYDRMPEKGSKEWCKAFADFVRDNLSTANGWVQRTVARMEQRTDLYWDGVAEMIEPLAKTPEPTPFSRLYSLVQDGDVIAARAYARSLDYYGGDFALDAIIDEVFDRYRFIEDDEALRQWYEDSYVNKSGTAESETTFRDGEFQTPRGKAIEAEVAKLPAGSVILEYGCGSGHVLAPLARIFPDKTFIGCDYSQTAVDVINKGAAEKSLPNLSAFVNGPRPVVIQSRPVDMVICSEVLEHSPEPWTLVREVESLVKPGGRVILTTPFGAWEPQGFERTDHWTERFHLWCFDKPTYREMLGTKPNESWRAYTAHMDGYGRPIGNIVYSYDANHEEPHAIDPLAKALRHHSRQTCAAAVIAYNNEDTILRMLNSLDKQVQAIQIALGPCTDNTRSYVEQWGREHPWVRLNVLDVPKIEAWKFGFDDARNASVQGLASSFEWVLWIDTDEYLSGDVRKYLRGNCLDAYLLAQHHFTVEPRGKSAEIDRPARLFRTASNYKARGHIHEHFEVPEGGPGRAYLTPDLDIGHIGYVNEKVRKARFDRNFPFLQWDHETGKDRKLHHFLWFRDLVHQMRFEYNIKKNPIEALRLAQEAKKYYNEHCEDMAAFGPGLFYSLQYMIEVNSVLNKGVLVEVTVKFDDRSAVLASRFENYESLERVFKQLVKPEFEERGGRYY